MPSSQLPYGSLVNGRMLLVTAEVSGGVRVTRPRVGYAVALSLHDPLATAVLFQRFGCSVTASCSTDPPRSP
jgi:hypothetical protein